MQAITLAIGKNGINFFAQHYLAGTLSALLGKMTPPDFPTTVPDFSTVDPLSIGFGAIVLDAYSNIQISLAQGFFSQFAPAYHSVSQGVSGDGKAAFSLYFVAGPFGVQYVWGESFTKEVRDEFTQPGHGRITTNSQSLEYTENFQEMDISIAVQFGFDPQQNEWTFRVPQSTAVTKGAISNIPRASVLHFNDAPCQTNNLLVATQTALDAINFSDAAQTLLTGIIQSIPDSGDLGEGMLYDFSIGDSGMMFPNNDGIQIGIKGGTSYQGEAFPGNTAVALPLPPALTDADSHHLNLFVSDTEISALCWCFYKAGKLNLLVNPQDLPDPSALHVSKYTALEPTLKPYAAFVMQANIEQNSPPTTAIQTIWQFDETVMNQLKTVLPAAVFQQIQFLQGNAFASKQSLETSLQSHGVAANWFDTLENASAETAMLLTQDMTMTLTIQNEQPTPPVIVFSVQRTDLLTGLQLGIGANQRQTLQFGFANLSNSARFVSSSIPGFDGRLFESYVWPLLGEFHYMQNLQNLGKAGVPLPIMNGFRFDFDHAVVALNAGYVSILANVLYQSS